jgi:hypothetical protein
MRVALLLLVAACWSSPPATAPTSSPEQADGPAPTIAWDDHHLVDRLLPAIAADGSVVVLGIEDPDGARGNPNFRIELRGRNDKTRWTHQVLTVQDVESGTFFDESGPLAPLRDRIATANAELARLHTNLHLVPLPKMTIERSDNAPLADQTAHGGNLVVAWKANHIIVTDERGDGKAVLADVLAPATWLAAPSRSNTHECVNPAYLDQAWAAPERRLVVITVEYEGTDACWEPDAQPHVVAW